MIASIHILVEKCYKVSNNVEDFEEDVDNPIENIFGSRLYVFCVALFLINVVILRTSVIGFLSLRIRFLIFQDWGPTFVFIPFVLYCYCKNPHLRNFVWKKMINSSSVHPQNNYNDIELESI